MREPKYRLSKQDSARFQELVIREALEVSPRKFKHAPPLTEAERAELESLQRKRNCKVWSHPRMKEAKAAHRNSLRRLNRAEKALRMALINKRVD